MIDGPNVTSKGKGKAVLKNKKPSSSRLVGSGSSGHESVTERVLQSGTTTRKHTDKLGLGPLSLERLAKIGWETVLAMERYKDDQLFELSTRQPATTKKVCAICGKALQAIWQEALKKKGMVSASNLWLLSS